MTTNVFTPTMSTNEIWRDNDTTRCLTDDLDAIEADIAAIDTSNFASANHTHSGYADINHTHSNYALSNHTHPVSCCTSSSSVSSQTLTASAITTITINGFSINTDISCFSIENSGIKVAESGNYLISASVSLACSTISGVRTVHIFKNNTEILSARGDEGKNYPSQGALGIAAKIIPLNAGDVIYLKARSMVCDGTAHTSNPSTHLTIVKL